MSTRRMLLSLGCAVAFAAGVAGAQDLVGPVPPAESGGPVVSARESLALGPSRKAADATGGPAPESLFKSATRTGAALGGVLALAFAGAWLTKRIAKSRGGLVMALGAGGRAPSGVLLVLGRYPAGPGQQFVLLKLERRILLLSQSQRRGRGATGGFQTLCEITDPEEVASILQQTNDESEQSLTKRFSSLLHRAETEVDDAVGESRRHERGAGGDSLELLDDQPLPHEQILRQRLDRYRQIDSMAGAANRAEWPTPEVPGRGGRPW